MTYAEDLGRLGPRGPLSRAVLVTVAGLTLDPARVIVTDGDARWDVDCLTSYTGRAVGDRILAVQLDGGTWLGLGRIGGTPTPAPDLTVVASDAVCWDGANRSRGALRVDSDRTVLWTNPGVIGGTVNSMLARITRTDTGDQAPLRLAVWNLNFPPGLTNRWDTGVLTVPGQTVWIPVPATQRGQIAAGQGLAAYAETDEHAAEFTADLELHVDT